MILGNEIYWEKMYYNGFSPLDINAYNISDFIAKINNSDKPSQFNSDDKPFQYNSDNKISYTNYPHYLPILLLTTRTLLTTRSNIPIHKYFFTLDNDKVKYHILHLWHCAVFEGSIKSGLMDPGEYNVDYYFDFDYNFIKAIKPG